MENNLSDSPPPVSGPETRPDEPGAAAVAAADRTPNGRQFCPSKVMHVMTPGPKTYQNHKKSPDKEPKFVPYEPYKAAVRSIVPELSQPAVAVFKRRLSTASNCSKASSAVEDKEDAMASLGQEKQVKIEFYFIFLLTNLFFGESPDTDH